MVKLDLSEISPKFQKSRPQNQLNMGLQLHLYGSENDRVAHL